MQFTFLSFLFPPLLEEKHKKKNVTDDDNRTDDEDDEPEYLAIRTWQTDVVARVLLELVGIPTEVICELKNYKKYENTKK